MQPVYDLQAPKSATIEKALVEPVNAGQRERWRKENRKKIEAYNQLVENQGCSAMA